MHRLLFASTATLALVAGSAASAQTVIDTKRTTPVRTATVNNGAAGDISITTAGSVVTKPVEADALCLVRPEQIGKAGWAARFRERMTAKKAGKKPEGAV